MRATCRFACIVMIAWLFWCMGAAADGSCGQAGNLAYNCNFDNFTDRGNGIQAPEGWQPWVTMGTPAFDADLHGSAPGAPAQRIWSDGGPWTAGLYQRVRVTPGKGYLARIQWAPPRCAGMPCQDIERKIGIDPLGGTDPLSPRVVWGASSWLAESMPDLHASAYAEGDTITILVWTHHPTSHGADEVFLDGVVLIEDASMPPRPTVTPTALPAATARPTRRPAATQAPAAETAVPPSSTPTDTSTPTATGAPIDTPTPASTATLTPTPTDTPTPAPPTNTPLPTRTPLPTVVPVARMQSDLDGGPASGSPPRAAARTQGDVVLLYVAGAALLGVALSAGAGAWLWRRGRGTAGEVGEIEHESSTET